MSDLSQAMQERLDTWRKRVPNAIRVRKEKSPGNYVQRRGDYGDDIRDYQEKEAKEWSEALQKDTIYRMYNDPRIKS